MRTGWENVPMRCEADVLAYFAAWSLLGPVAVPFLGTERCALPETAGEHETGGEG